MAVHSPLCIRPPPAVAIAFVGTVCCRHGGALRAGRVGAQSSEFSAVSVFLLRSPPLPLLGLGNQRRRHSPSNDSSVRSQSPTCEKCRALLNSKSVLLPVSIDRRVWLRTSSSSDGEWNRARREQRSEAKDREVSRLSNRFKLFRQLAVCPSHMRCAPFYGGCSPDQVAGLIDCTIVDRRRKDERETEGGDKAALSARPFTISAQRSLHSQNVHTHRGLIPRHSDREKAENSSTTQREREREREGRETRIGGSRGGGGRRRREGAVADGGAIEKEEVVEEEEEAEIVRKREVDEGREGGGRTKDSRHTAGQLTAQDRPSHAQRNTDTATTSATGHTHRGPTKGRTDEEKEGDGEEEERKGEEEEGSGRRVDCVSQQMTQEQPVGLGTGSTTCMGARLAAGAWAMPR